MNETAEDFDRSVRNYELARQASLQHEDQYVDAVRAPVLSEEARRQRRALILSGVVTLLMTLFDMTPNKFPWYEETLKAAHKAIVIVGAGVSTLYFWVEFSAYAARDYRNRLRLIKVTYERLKRGLKREKSQSNESFSGDKEALRGMLDDCDRREELYRDDPTIAADSRWSQFAGIGGVSWLEYRLPHLIAALALGSCFWSWTNDFRPPAFLASEPPHTVVPSTHFTLDESENIKASVPPVEEPPR